VSRAVSKSWSRLNYFPSCVDPGSARRLYPRAGHHMQAIRAIPARRRRIGGPGVPLSCRPPLAVRPAGPYRGHRETVTCPPWSEELVRGYLFPALAGAGQSRDQPVHCLCSLASNACRWGRRRALLLRQRAASGISEVTQTSTAEMRSAIQLSAASALSPTRTILTFEVSGGRIGREPLETTNTLS
jgi:hypothetical protein